MKHWGKSLVRGLGLEVSWHRRRTFDTSIWFPDSSRSERSRLVLAFSLYGSDPYYTKCALTTVRSYAHYFPGWSLVYFVGASIPEAAVQQLDASPSVATVPMTTYPEDASAMFWRLLALEMDDVDVVCFRDVDSHPLPRERAAVDEWLASGKTAHFMRDHPHHDRPIMGGMWGCRATEAGFISGEIRDFGPNGRYGGDQNFLASRVYPRLVDSALIHQDEIYFQDLKPNLHRPFPVQREGEQYIGRRIDFHEVAHLQTGEAVDLSFSRFNQG